MILQNAFGEWRVANSELKKYLLDASIRYSPLAIRDLYASAG
jgi:hypothetical protein